MEIQTIEVEKRTPAGSRAAARLRRAGKLPVILYGHKLDPLPLMVDYHELVERLHHGVHLVNLRLGNQDQACLIKEIQYDHLGEKPVHIDLTRVDLEEKVTVNVQIELRGRAKGLAKGGLVRRGLTEVEVECRVTDIPDSIRIDISDLDLDEVLHVKDLKLSAGLEAKSDPGAVIVMVREPKAKVSEAAEEGAETPEATPSEPEVLSKGKEEAATGESST